MFHFAGVSTGKSRVPGQTAASPDTTYTSEKQHRGAGGVSPSTAPLEAAPVDVEFDDEMSSDEEFLLIEMEADDSGESSAPIGTAAQPAQDPADGGAPGNAAVGPTSPFEPAGEACCILFIRQGLRCDCM